MRLLQKIKCFFGYCQEYTIEEFQKIDDFIWTKVLSEGKDVSLIKRHRESYDKVGKCKHCGRKL